MKVHATARMHGTRRARERASGRAICEVKSNARHQAVDRRRARDPGHAGAKMRCMGGCAGFSTSYPPHATDTIIAFRPCTDGTKMRITRCQAMLQTRKIKHARAAGDSGIAVRAENVFHHAFLAKSIHKRHMSFAYSTWAYSRIMPNSWLALKKGITVTKRLPRYEAPLFSLVS